MITKKIEKRLDKVLKNVDKAISDRAKSGDIYTAAMSGEGYAGGYHDALNDVINFLNGVIPRRRNYWD